MPATIKNLTPRPLYVSLNTGSTLRLSPRGASSGIDEVQVKGNAHIEKLLSQRMISVEYGEKTTDEAKEKEEDDSRPRTRKKT